MSESAKCVRRRWKRAESDIAARLGGRRIPITGRQRGDVPDVEHPWLSVEVKERKALPDWIHDAMAQAVAAKVELEHKAREENKDSEWLPIVVLHQAGRRHDNDYMVLRLRDFVDWFFGEEVLSETMTDAAVGEGGGNR